MRHIRWLDSYEFFIILVSFTIVWGMKTEIKGISLFSSAGIGEYFLSRIGIRIVAANELIPKRADLYRKIYP